MNRRTALKSTVFNGLTLLPLISAACFLPASAEDLLIVGGRRFELSTGDLVSNRGILIKKGLFHAIDGETGTDRGAAEKVGDKWKLKVRRIELKPHQTILPGLIDLHAHYNVRLFRKRREEFLVMPVVYLANGATVTFSCGEYDPQGMLQLRKDLEAGKKRGPRLINSGPYFGRARPGWGRERTKEEIVADVRKWAKTAGGFKAKSIRADELRILVEEAHRHGKTVTGHLGSGFRSTVNPRDAIEMGIDRIEHFLGGDALPANRSAYGSLPGVTPEMPEVLEIIRVYVEKGVWFDATLSAYGYFGDRGEEFDPWQDEKSFFTQYVREKLRDKKRQKIEAFEKIYQVKQKTIKAFHDAGGKITLGTDHFSDGTYLPGFGVHRELDALVRSGIPEAEAIRIASINGAQALGIEKDHGSISVGKVADLYIINGNPLENIRNTRNGVLVVRAGQVHDCRKLFDSVRGKLGPRSEEEEKDW